MRVDHARLARILSLVALPLVVIAFVMLLQKRSTHWYEWLLFGSITLNLLISLLQKQLRGCSLVVLQTISFVSVILAIVGIIG